MVGSDDVQHYDDKGSESSSPSSQEHLNSENPFAEGYEKEAEKREGGSSDQLAVSEQSSREVGVSSGDNVTTEESIVQIEWELKSEEGYGSKEGSIESKEANTGGSSGSSSSSSRSSSNSSHGSSDDESHLEKMAEVVETGHAVDTLSEVAKQLNTSISSRENRNAASKTASVTTPDKASLMEDVVQIDESSFGDYPVISLDNKLEVQEVGYKVEAQVHADKKLPSFDNSTGISPVLVDWGLKKVEDKVVLMSEEKPTVPIDVNNSAMEGRDAKLLLSINDATVHASKDADHIKASDSPECSESQVMAF